MKNLSIDGRTIKSHNFATITMFLRIIAPRHGTLQIFYILSNATALHFSFYKPEKSAKQLLKLRKSSEQYLQNGVRQASAIFGLRKPLRSRPKTNNPFRTHYCCSVNHPRASKFKNISFKIRLYLESVMIAFSLIVNVSASTVQQFGRT